jgi:hypothetical protein
MDHSARVKPHTVPGRSHFRTLPPGRRGFSIPALLPWKIAGRWTNVLLIITEPFPPLPQISCQAAVEQLAGIKWRERRGSNAPTFPRFPKKNARRSQPVNGKIQLLSISAFRLKGISEIA